MVRRASLLQALTAMVLLAVLLGGSHATVHRARALRANAALISVWDADDACSQSMEIKDCKHDVSCGACLTHVGCAIESSTGKCVSISRVNTTVHGGVEYLLAGQSQYCDASDDACGSCGADETDSDSVCRGAKGCVCVHQCELAAARTPSCESSDQFINMYYVLMAVALLAPTMILKRMYRGLTSGLPSSTERRDMRRAAHDANPLTMKLDGWRSFIESERAERSEKTEIKLCPTRSSEANTTEPIERTQPDATTTGGDDFEMAYAAVMTPTDSDRTRLGA